MARKRRRIPKIQSLRDLNFSQPKFEISPEAKRGIIIVILLTFGILSLLSLLDLAGTLGVYLNDFLKLVFGVSRWWLPVVLLIIGYFLLRPKKYAFKFSNGLGLVIFILSFNGLIHLIFHQADLIEAAKLGLGGGWSGVVLSWLFLKIMGALAAGVVMLALAIIGFLLLFENYIITILEKRNESREVEDEKDKESIWQKFNQLRSDRRIKKAQAEREKMQAEPEVVEEEAVPVFSKRAVEVEQAGGKNSPPAFLSEEDKENAQLNLGVVKFKKTRIDLPLDLLESKTTIPKAGDIKANQLIIQKTLENFGIPAEMGDVQVGPTVAQYTLKPADGVKLSRITGLSDNLALGLAAHPIRIEAPIPGRSLVGIEVPNQSTAIVPLKDILASDQFKNRKSNLDVALGKDVMGKPWLASLDRMPHLLIAGATNSGKSVCINSLIVSLLYQNGPGDLKFIMVDPKRVELPVYNGIPHLLTPVITDVKKTVNALRWAIKEMEKRFDTLQQAHHRNIGSYNNAVEDKMPYIVIIIDELADLMASAGAEVEAAIVRLSQMSRAVGIHLVLATQRPSVDVLTGLIKANITSRVAFSVASLVDSRTILDQSGAEKLLGRGDMLYVSADISKPKRLQGAFASDDDIKRVIEYLKNQEEPEYIDEVVERQQMSGSDFQSVDDGESDPLLPEAKEVIMRAKKASASLLQRRLRVGYARAARILDLLEEQGVIGPGDGAKPREVLMNTIEDDNINGSGQEDFLDDEEVDDSESEKKEF
ncbi:MAG: DNA translocase FtsK 4TM domain-containing protein [Patescibacteria group bacterium]|jgi:S-DNA-T family DNA segregation ATPase FtsK/SpoIIIE